ncbi:MAG: hypothetical protein KC656_05710 [Myxococcales bacterium]|nr:hypothetical protein [Myxococcales bacterium]
MDTRVALTELPARRELTEPTDPAAIERFFDERLVEREAEAARRAEAEAGYDPRYLEALAADAKQGLSGVLERAGEAGVPALVVLGGRGCKPCAELAHDVLFAEGDPAKLSGRVEWALLNMMDAGIADQLKAWGLPISLPTLLIVRADGTLVAQSRGYGGREPFEKWLRRELRQGR